MKSGGYGQYAELSQIRTNIEPDSFHDVYGKDLTDWSSAYDKNDKDINIDCVMNNLQKIQPLTEEQHNDNQSNMIEQYTNIINNDSEQDLCNLDINNNEEFWYFNPGDLIRSDRIFHIIPSTKQTYDEYFNSLTRLGIGVSVILALLYKDCRYLLLIIALLIIIVFLYINHIQTPHDFVSWLHGDNDNYKQNYEMNINGLTSSIKDAQLKKKECYINKNYMNNKDQNIKSHSFKTFDKNKIDNFCVYGKCDDSNRPTENTIYAKKHLKKGPRASYESIKGTYNLRLNPDMVCADLSQNDSTGGYDWIKQSAHADYRGNSRFLNNKTKNSTMKKLMLDLNNAYGQEIAERNSFIPVHPRDIINTNFDEFLYGKNLDRRLYYSR
jgi:hypothetical protein